MKRILPLMIISIFFAATVHAESRLNNPAPPQEVPVVIKGGTLYTISGETIENGVLAFSEGKIDYVGTEEGFDIDTAGWMVIDARGQNVYPGMIASNTRVGLVEIDQLRATRDFSETGDFNPNVRSLVAYNTDSDIIPTLRANGVLLVQTVPSGGRLSGTSSIVQMDAWNWEDAAYVTDNGIHLNWPGRFSGGGWWSAPEAWEKRDIRDQLAEIETFFADAWSYYHTESPAKVNLKLEAMQGLFSGEQQLYIQANDARGIKEAIALSEKYNIQMVLVGARHAEPVLDLIAEKNISVILDETHRNPSRPHDDIDLTYLMPLKLAEKDIRFTFGRHHSWRIRNLPFYAGSAVAHGLDHDAALRAVTLSAAEIHGIEDRSGSLEVGKDANIIISSGDILDMKTSRVQKAFIQGRNVSLRHHQEQLFEIYMNKYGLDADHRQ